MTKYVYCDEVYEDYSEAENDCIDDNYDDFLESAFSEIGFQDIMNALADNDGEKVYYRIVDLIYEYADEYIKEIEDEDEDE